MLSYKKNPLSLLCAPRRDFTNDLGTLAVFLLKSCSFSILVIKVIEILCNAELHLTRTCAEQHFRFSIFHLFPRVAHEDVALVLRTTSWGRGACSVFPSPNLHIWSQPAPAFSQDWLEVEIRFMKRVWMTSCPVAAPILVVLHTDSIIHAACCTGNQPVIRLISQYQSDNYALN